VKGKGREKSGRNCFETLEEKKIREEKQREKTVISNESIYGNNENFEFL
jgi:hypothetical protein